MERNPLKLAASYQCQQALKNLQIVASGGVLTPSQARQTAETVTTYRNTFIAATDSSNEQFSEVLFGYGFGDDE